MNDIMEREKSLEDKSLTKKEKYYFNRLKLDETLRRFHNNKLKYSWEELKIKANEEYGMVIDETPNERDLYDYFVNSLKEINRTLDKRLNYFSWW